MMGLAEREWEDQLELEVSKEVGYWDQVEFARKGEKWLREQGCDLVIVLSHMRLQREQILAKEVPEIDMILGGHDHVFHVEVVNGVLLLKSGTDF
mmetsp:Transcript_35962/g.26712  ORF Transcript_35962/g.26712 Transcript_35962/m.26712 type:complete len:95 (+) Transcript_35962:413-697(+)